MSRNYTDGPNGYEETLRKGLDGVRRFRDGLSRGTGTRAEQIERLRAELKTADAIVVGAGAGLSTSAGFVYSGERFMRYFPDFAARFGITDMYSGGFYPFPDEETYWAWWSRNIYCNRYVMPPKPVYENLLRLVTGKEYFVITTNVDHLFQKAGFDKQRLFYTQGDYGLFQGRHPAVQKTWDNEAWVMQAMAAQGFVRDAEGVFVLPEDGRVSLRIPSSLIPRDPLDGGPVVPNLRVDDSFVEDEGWHRASAAYADFLRQHDGQHVLYLEIGVGSNTPVIIKYPFWQMTNDNPKAVYCCLNYNEACCPKQIEDRSLCIDGDTGTLLAHL
ncbi:MAG: hypothetical protein IJ175_00705 [Clostridia bacterium]|nr:hypothetical protein [Clostridia bacterium]